MAASNSAARVIGGDTVHSLLHLYRESGFNLDSLSQSVNDSLEDLWTSVECLIIEELSLISPPMYGGVSFRVCMARRHSGAEPSLYTTREHSFGRIPLVIVLGDFMQLAPLDGRVRMSLIM